LMLDKIYGRAEPVRLKSGDGGCAVVDQACVERAT
jgi:hypothetical protein